MGRGRAGWLAPSSLTVHALERQGFDALLQLYILLQGEGEPLQPRNDLFHLPFPWGAARDRPGPAGGPYKALAPLKGQGPTQRPGSSRALKGPGSHPVARWLPGYPPGPAVSPTPTPCRCRCPRAPSPPPSVSWGGRGRAPRAHRCLFPNPHATPVHPRSQTRAHTFHMNAPPGSARGAGTNQPQPGGWDWQALGSQRVWGRGRGAEGRRHPPPHLPLPPLGPQPTPPPCGTPDTPFLAPASSSWESGGSR